MMSLHQLSLALPLIHFGYQSKESPFKEPLAPQIQQRLPFDIFGDTSLRQASQPVRNQPNSLCCNPAPQKQSLSYDIFSHEPSLSDTDCQAMAKQIDYRGRDGHGVGNRVYFSLTTDRRIPTRDFGRIQMYAGWHPAGYGINMVTTSEITAKTKTTQSQYCYEWSCAASCD